jgi:predicted dehydrogenase
VVTAHMARSNDEIAAEDIATITLRRRSDGVPVLLAGNLAQPGEPEQARDQLRIIGSDATITLDGFRISARGATEMVEDFDPAATYEGSYAAAIGHFLDGLASGAPFETAPTDNLRTAALVAAAYAAAARRGEGETAL